MPSTNQLLRCLVFAVAILGTVSANPQTQRPATSSSQKKPTTFWEWVLRFTGVSANPSTLKGADDEVVTGQVWLAEVRANTRWKITADGGYRSPVFFPSGTDMLVIKGEDVIRLSVDSSSRQTVAKVSGITKLVGFGRDDPSQVLLLTEDDAGHPNVELLSVNNGKSVQLPYDPQSSRDRQMMEDLQGWERSYGLGTVYVRRQAIQAMSGTVDRTNVFWKQPGLDPVNISQCELTNCGQPSASTDGSKIAFIKALD